MINITFPDGSVKEFESGISGLGIAKALSNSLAKQVLAVTVNEEVWDLSRPIEKDAAIKLHKWDEEEAKHAFWHSSAHLMAEAIEALYPYWSFHLFEFYFTLIALICTLYFNTVLGALYDHRKNTRNIFNC